LAKCCGARHGVHPKRKRVADRPSDVSPRGQPTPRADSGSPRRRWPDPDAAGGGQVLPRAVAGPRGTNGSARSRSRPDPTASTSAL